MKIAAIILVVLGLISLMGFAEYASSQAEHSDCSRRGGHISSSTQVVTTYTGKGSGVGTETTDFCLSPDGRILKIY